MDSKNSCSHAEATNPCSTRRYTYSGHGGQNLDKTLILQKSNTCSDDTVLLRLCKRSCGRVSWSPCVKGKLALAALMVIMALLCYFNLSSSYLPKTCRILSMRRSGNDWESVETKVVHVRTKNSISGQFYGLDPLLRKDRSLVNDFAKNVAVRVQDSRDNPVTTLRHTTFRTVMALRLPLFTAPPSMKYFNSHSQNNQFDEAVQGVDRDERFGYGPRQKAEMTLLSRIIKSGKSAYVD